MTAERRHSAMEINFVEPYRIDYPPDLLLAGNATLLAFEIQHAQNAYMMYLARGDKMPDRRRIKREKRRIADRVTRIWYRTHVRPSSRRST